MRVSAAIARSGRTPSEVATEAGIARTTLLRKMRGVGTFSVVEIALIAEALGVDWSDLLPASIGRNAA